MTLSIYSKVNSEMIEPGSFLIPLLGKEPLYISEKKNFDNYIIPVDFPLPRISDVDLKKFNLEPLESYEEIMSPLGFDPTPDSIAKLLFFSHLSPHAMSQILFLSGKFQRSFLYNFFSAPVTEYMEFLKAIRVLFSRIALPLHKKTINTVFHYAGKVLYDNGFYPELNADLVIVLVKISIYFSAMRSARSNVSFIDFQDAAKRLCDVTAMRPLTLERLYKELDETPIPLQYSFADPRFPPNAKAIGTLSIRTGVMKYPKRRHFSLQKDLLLFSTVDNPADYKGGIDISNITITIPAPKEKEKMSMLIRGRNDQSIVFDVVKGKRQSMEKKEIVLIASSTEDLESWRSSLQHYKFRRILASLIMGQSQTNLL